MKGFTMQTDFLGDEGGSAVGGWYGGGENKRAAKGEKHI